MASFQGIIKRDKHTSHVTHCQYYKIRSGPHKVTNTERFHPLGTINVSGDSVAGTEPESRPLPSFILDKLSVEVLSFKRPPKCCGPGRGTVPSSSSLS